MKAKNRLDYTGNREDVVAEGNMCGMDIGSVHGSPPNYGMRPTYRRRVVISISSNSRYVCGV
jgi:hypothetical protein